ncbi:hypothetical protein BH09ACT10_BH09ACT10_15100 [soil metagenome]
MVVNNYSVAMRWENLFRDLIDQATELDLAARDLQVAELAQGAWGQLRWADLIGHREVTIRVEHVGQITGRVAQVTGAWVLVESPTFAFAIAHRSVLGIAILDATGAASSSAVSDRLGWGHAFRAFARDRDRILVTRIDGSSLSAYVRVVAADFVVLEHEAGRDEVVPFAAVAAVRCPLAR